MVHTKGLNWHAVHTRSRHEKQVNRDLAGQDIETFLPLVRVPSSRRDRRAEYDKPLFPGYLFIRIVTEERAWHVIQTRGVCTILGPGPWEYTPVPEQQIESIRTLIESNRKLDPFPYLKVGQMVRIKRGPLKGVEGRLIEKRGITRLIIDVDILGNPSPPKSTPTTPNPTDAAPTPRPAVPLCCTRNPGAAKTQRQTPQNKAQLLTPQ